MKLTHYRKNCKSEYLSHKDLIDPIRATIVRVAEESDRNGLVKDRLFNVAFFKEKHSEGVPLKPMVLNVTNVLTLGRHFRSTFFERWGEVEVVIYVNENTGSKAHPVGLGLRIAEKKQELTPDSRHWVNAVKRTAKDGYTAEGVKTWVTLTPENEALLIEEAKKMEAKPNEIS